MQIPSGLRNPYLLLTLTALFWSGNMVLGRGLRADIPPIALAFWRWAIAFTLVLPFALPHWPHQAHILKRHWLAVLVLGALGVAGYNTLAYLALQTTTATNAVLLNAFIPVATVTLAWAFLHKPLGRTEALGVLISLCGAVTIITRGDPTTLTQLSLNRGDLWMMSAVLVWALYTLGLQFRPPGVAPMLLLAAFTLVGLFILAPLYAWEIARGEGMRLNLSSLAGLAYVGIFPSFIGYIFYNRGVLEVGANRASLFIHLMPVFGTLLATIFLDERPALYHLTGISLIFLGIFLATLRRRSLR